MPASVANQIALLEFARRLINTFASHRQHVRQKLLRQLKLISFNAVMSHQQPARQPCFDRVKLITDRGLRDLSQK